MAATLVGDPQQGDEVLATRSTTDRHDSTGTRALTAGTVRPAARLHELVDRVATATPGTAAFAALHREAAEVTERLSNAGRLPPYLVIAADDQPPVVLRLLVHGVRAIGAR